MATIDKLRDDVGHIEHRLRLWREAAASPRSGLTKRDIKRLEVRLARVKLQATLVDTLLEEAYNFISTTERG